MRYIPVPNKNEPVDGAQLDTSTIDRTLPGWNAAFMRQSRVNSPGLPAKAGVPVVVSSCAPVDVPARLPGLI